MCFVFPGLICTLWGGKFWEGFWVAGALRYIVVLHFTWLVNSAAHFFGDHPYDNESWPAENPFVSVAAIGEGWHNWHHKYPFDYAASEYGITKQFNPTKLIIDLFLLVGLASEPKRATGAWHRLRMVQEEKFYGAGAEETKKSS
jgi:stearoyl-CoA desaturase (delta-9 desaturase)